MRTAPGSRIARIVMRDADAFLDYLRPSRRHWRPSAVQDSSSPASAGWLFRGQADARWNLVPSAFKGRMLAEYAPIAAPAERTRHGRLAAQVAAEVAAVRSFIALADLLGIAPVAVGDLEADFHRLGRELDRFHGDPAPDTCPELPRRLLREAMALAQHHGIPTRLLDWTTSSLVSAYFAARDVWTGRVRSAHISVWALDVGALSAQSALAVVSGSYSRNPFMRAQRGAFTYDREANRRFLASGRWRAHDHVIAESAGGRAALRQVLLPSAQSASLLRMLYLEGISPAHLMPTLDQTRETCRYHRQLFGIAAARARLPAGASTRSPSRRAPTPRAPAG